MTDLAERLDRWANTGWTEMETGDVSQDLREAAEVIATAARVIEAARTFLDNAGPSWWPGESATSLSRAIKDWYQS